MRNDLLRFGTAALIGLFVCAPAWGQVTVHSATSPFDEVFQAGGTYQVDLDVENNSGFNLTILYTVDPAVEVLTQPRLYDSLNNEVTLEYFPISDPANPAVILDGQRLTLKIWVTADRNATVDTIKVDGQFVGQNTVGTRFTDPDATTTDVWLSLHNIHDAIGLISVPGQPHTTFGFDLAAGDYDNDLDDDLFVGDPGSLTVAGQVWVFASGQPVGCGVSTLAGGGILTAPISVAGDGYGNALASGDVNGDGFADLLVGASTSNTAYLYLADGLGWFNPPIVLAKPAPLASDRFGFSVGLFDVNNDGAGDAIVGNAGPIGPISGEVWVFLGPTYAVPATPLLSPTPTATGNFGWAVAGSDFNGDGFDDLAVGAPREPSTGNVHVFTGPALTFFTTLGDAPNFSPAFGWSVACGDVTGTTNPDLVVGAPSFDTAGVANSGHVVVHTAPALTRSIVLSEPIPEFPGFLGYDLSIGDVDGDGENDIVAGAPRSSPGGVFESGEVFVFMSATSTVRYAFRPRHLQLPQRRQWFGHAVVAGQFNTTTCGIGLEVAIGSDLVTLGLPPGSFTEEVLVFQVEFP